MAEKRVLITGGAGFVGSHLCEAVLARGDEVLCVDNFYTGARRNVAHLMANPRFELLRHDVCFPLHVEVDQIYNLACPASPIHYQSDPVQTTKTSVMGALNMLGLAKRLKVPVLQASTSECYGDPAVHPQPETYWGHVNPIGPRSCYDEGKRCAETLFFDYHRQHGLDVKVARIFNTYGPRMHPDDGRVVSNFIVQALKGQDITLYGDGAQTRSFCYVDDLVDGLMRLMGTARGVTGPINLGNPGEFTILQLAETVVAMTGAPSRLVFRPLPQDDPRQRQPDLARAKALLDWQPSTALREGLARTIDYFRGLLALPAAAASSEGTTMPRPVPPPADRPALPLVVMGVSGSGKSTIAAQLAGRLGLPYVDGDDLHPQRNVDKMQAGMPLDDEDRWPWLDRVADTLRASADDRSGVVLACSALKRAYRDRLRAGTGGRVRFAFLDVGFDEIERRLKKRVHHFMPRQLLQSQFDALERPGADESDVMTIPSDGSAEGIVAEIAGRLGR